MSDKCRILVQKEYNSETPAEFHYRRRHTPSGIYPDSPEEYYHTAAQSRSAPGCQYRQTR